LKTKHPHKNNPTECGRADNRRMRSPHRFLTSPHQRRRLVLWALAMLAWIAAVLLADKPSPARQLRQRGDISIESLTRLTMRLMIVRAAELSGYRRRKPRFWRHGRDLRRRHLIRSMLGGNLRRALKHRDLATRIARVISVLRNLDAYARLLAKRMRNRLTRLFAIIAAPTRAIPAPETHALTPAFADSS
jgi:hypothetical protein